MRLPAFLPRAATALLCVVPIIPAAVLAGDSASGVGDETELAPVLVSGSRIDLRDELSPGVVSVAYPDDVKGEHKSIPDLLDQIPGVYVRRLSGSAHYTTATIRGSAPSQVNVYIDGVPLNTASETAADLSTLPISNVERIEVYRGTTPARFSGAPIGGAINIVTKKPKDFGGSVSAGARAFGGEQYSANLNLPLLGGNLLLGMDKDRSVGDFKYKDFGIESMHHHVYSDGLPYCDPSLANCYAYVGGKTRNAALPAERTRLNNSSDKENVLLKWEDRRFVVKYAQNDIERYLPKGVSPGTTGYSLHSQDIPNSLMPGTNDRNRQQILQQEALAGWRDSFGGLDLGLNLSWLDKAQQYRNLDIQPPYSGQMGKHWTQYDTRRKGIAGDATYAFDTGFLSHQFEVHAERYWEVLNSEMSNRPPTSDFIAEFKRTKTSLQLQDTMTIAALGNLQVTPIFRMEKLEGPVIGSRYSPLTGPGGKYDWQRTGSLSVKKSFDNGWLVFGNHGDYIRYPNFYEIYGNGLGLVPNADSLGHAIQLVPETGTNSDLGFGWNGRFSEKVRGDFRLTYFQRDARDAITLYSTPFAAKYTNSGDTRTRGLELEGKVAWGRQADLQFAFTRQEGKYVGKGGYYYFGGASTSQRWPGQTVHTLQNPEMVANVRLNLHFLGGDLTTFIAYTHIGKVWRDVNTWENPLKTFDLGAHYRVAKGWKLSTGINDIFNAGPKQTMSGEGVSRDGGRLMGVTCANPDPFWGCVFQPDAHSVYEYLYAKSNVNYPQQGRTWYMTLSYSF
jgi:outer membrane receptor protein involved in Fe transport